MMKVNLLVVERRGVKIGGDGHDQLKAIEPQAIDKVFVDKLIHAKVLAQSLLGKISCSVKGVVSKDLGENHFVQARSE